MPRLIVKLIDGRSVMELPDRLQIRLVLEKYDTVAELAIQMSDTKNSPFYRNGLQY